MQKPVQKEWDLTIDPDTVRVFVLKARAISAALNHDYEAGGEHEVELGTDARDAHNHDGLIEEEAGDLTERELRALIGDLNLDERAELIAIMLVGRGDFDAAEWSEALAEARGRNLRRVSTYLLSIPMLGDWLEEGLEAIGA